MSAASHPEPKTAGLDVHARPPVDVAIAAELGRSLFGATGEVKELGSHQDRNFLIRAAEGPRVLKIANRSWTRSALEAQDAALALLQASAAPKAGEDAGSIAFKAPASAPSLKGPLIAEATIGGESYLVRMLTFVEGSPLTDCVYLSPAVVADLGRLAGSAAAALRGFEHPGLERPAGQWDLRASAEVIASLLPSVPDAEKRGALARHAAAATARVSAVASTLRLQAVHGDVTDDNVVAQLDEAGRLRPDGVIDWGDLARSWLVAELAVTCACVLRHRPDDALAVLPAIAEFHQQVPLSEGEVAALWPLVVLRGITLVASGEHQALLDPDNPSVTGPLASEWRIFDVASSLPCDVAEAAIRQALGMPPAPKYASQRAALAAARPLLPSLPAAAIAALDLSVTSPELHAGKFLEGAAAETALLRQQAALSGAAATRWGEARLTRSQVNSAAAPATVALGVELAVAAGAPVAAPWDVTVLSADVAEGLLVLDGPAGALVLRGVDAAAGAIEGASLPSGSALGTVRAAKDATEAAVAAVAAASAPLGRLHVQLCVEPSLCSGLSLPAFAVPGAHAAGWLAVCPDPSPLLRASLAAPADDVEDLLRRRGRVFARVQEHYYAQPMRIERGWRQHMVDSGCRAYVDMVNNVAAVGHAHPRLAAAAHAQLSLLNTNSRFHYAAVAELCERLVATAPEGLDTVLLVNSGSEAVDLALRMAQVVTGRQSIVSVMEAYHGWTMLSGAVTTEGMMLSSPTDGADKRPDWIRLVSAPNSFRGKFRGAAAADGYAEEVRVTVADMVAAGTHPAAFISEPLFGNAGGIVLPPGYLAAVYKAVRAAGGLCVADEVQAGYGRTGRHWWSHEAHGVVPDIITVAKAMGNGYPLGAVITRKDIAEAFQREKGRFFSSAGGSPAACVVGSTVLDIFRDERLQENARVVGDHIVARCTALAERYPIIGAVHGSGLYLGIELVRSRETLEPATAECYAICDRLRELGCIVQPASERSNVLKAKPPMCLSRESADFFVDALETTLRDGW
jgi:4-aminobutyrate aminotransferase-like enzyme/Ser/Thr protein kinase RdoA (MazF antagonist)